MQNVLSGGAIYRQPVNYASSAARAGPTGHESAVLSMEIQNLTVRPAKCVTSVAVFKVVGNATQSFKCLNDVAVYKRVNYPNVKL